jgi:hypothetical protein
MIASLLMLFVLYDKLRSYLFMEVSLVAFTYAPSNIESYE